MIEGHDHADQIIAEIARRKAVPAASSRAALKDQSRDGDKFERAWLRIVYDAHNAAEAAGHETSLEAVDAILRAALASGEAIGWKVVPHVADRNMLKAAAKAMSPEHRPVDYWMSVAKKHSTRYRAMLAARPVFPPPEI
jgi:predicted signal transduction protein with EAL and GGDEF domain